MTHWTEQDFTEWIYGLKSDSAHLNECSACRLTAQAVAEQRTKAVRPPDVAWEFLAAQRRSIYRRMERPEHNWAVSRWIASVAMLIMVAVVGLGLRYQSERSAPLASPADEKLFSELVSIEQSSEPRAIKPMESLFEK